MAHQFSVAFGSRPVANFSHSKYAAIVRSLNLNPYVFAGDHYVLKMRFVDHILDDQIVDQMRLRVVLPEGAEVKKLVTPYDVKRHQQEKHYTYLDTMGRPVVVASKANLVEGHIQDFEVIE